MNAAARQREALRQQMLLRALWRDARPGVVAGWLREPPQRARRGLQAYIANAGALAERALAAAYPTLQQLLGDESFAALARAHWQAHAPQRGDVAQWGVALPAFVAAAEQLAAEPYLADVARLEWALHAAEGAADADPALAGIGKLATCDPQATLLVPAPGAALVVSAHPIVSIWQAHRGEPPGQETDRFAAVRDAFARGEQQVAFVWRAGWRATACLLPPEQVAFVEAWLRGLSLGDALAAAGTDFAFDRWLAEALRQGWIAGLRAIDTPHPEEAA